MLLGDGVGEAFGVAAGVGVTTGKGRVVGSELLDEFGLGVFVLLLLPLVDGVGDGVGAMTTAPEILTA